MGKIIMNGNAYGSVGSDVEANPQGTATDTLNTIGIDNVIYEIQGGGGSGVYIEDELYVATQLDFSNITVNWDWNDYDLYIFQTNNALFNSELGVTQVLTKEQIQQAISTGVQQYFNGVKNSQCSYYIDTNLITARSNDDNVQIMGIRGIKTSGDYFSPVIYSTEEREIGVWKDNKPLYQKTIIVDSITHTGEIDVSSLNIDTVVKMNGIANYPNNQWVNFPFYHNDNYYVRVYYIIDGGGDISDNCIYFEVGNSARGVYTNGFLTLQYTKTTDVPGSGQYNTLGVPTVHIDSEEKVIGTYFGETLYEKSFTVIMNSTSVTIPNTSNISKIINVRGYILSNNTQQDTLPYSDSGDYMIVRNNVGSGITIYTTNWFVNNNAIAYANIQYTKTTD